MARKQNFRNGNFEPLPERGPSMFTAEQRRRTRRSSSGFEMNKRSCQEKYFQVQST